jgi:hypothetical protein
MGIIDSFEVIDVCGQQCCAIQLSRASVKFRHGALEAPTIQQSRERIYERLGLHSL